MRGTAAAARVTAAITAYGEVMTLKRRTTTAGTFADYQVKGYVRTYQPGELTGQLQSNDCEVNLSPAGQTPIKGDILVIQGRSYSILGAETVRLSGVTVAYRCWTRGG